MDPEHKEEENRLDDEGGKGSGDFGKVIDVLHNKQKLPSLRTYQGDMAEFIKEKNESVISIAVKQKEKKQKIEEKDKNFSPLHKTVKPTSLKNNIIIVAVSLLLIAAGAAVLFYIFNAMKQKSQAPVVVQETIIPYSHLITVSSTTEENFEKEIVKASSANGVNIFKISDKSGTPLLKAGDFFGFLKATPPSDLELTLKDDYEVGVISEDGETSNFLIITVNDFGQAFSGMLDWEQNMDKDLAFLNTNSASLASDDSSVTIAQTVPSTSLTATTSASTTKVIASSTSSTTAAVKISLKPAVYVWKDLIVKNKDTRGLVDESDNARIAYTFLDKNTILITNNLSAIGDISSIYASRSVVR